MYISKIKLHNFKGFKGDHELSFDSGINFFVGNNNCGKTTVFQAIDFISSKKAPEDIISKGVSPDNDYVSVEVELRGSVLSDIKNNNESPLKKYRSVVLEDDVGELFMRARRSSESDCAKICFLASDGDYKNVSGIDKTISALFETQIVWADTDAADIADFSKTKICGKIINSIVGDLTETEAWKNLIHSHEEAFGGGNESLTAKLKPFEKRLSQVMSEQYGETEVKFSFSLPELDNFLKTGDIILSENGIETKSFEKGNGMQRALALSLIQVYADLETSNNDETTSKPLFFLIDEPETFLHPYAQSKLLNALEKISKSSQIFLSTHSPYLLKKYKSQTHSLNVFSKQSDGFNNTPSSQTELDLFGASSPTWGEINYVAFGISTVEFHNELYGFIQAKAILEDRDNCREENFENWLEKKGLSKNKKYIRECKDGKTKPHDTTLPTYIRNIIHHPENQNNSRYTERELDDSLSSLLSIYKKIR